MSNDKNNLGLLKKRNVLTMGSPKSDRTTKTVTSHVEAHKPKEVKPAKVKQRKVKTVNTQQAPQQTQQKPQVMLSDFSLSTNANANNISIITMYQGQGVHAFTLPSIEYEYWQRANYQQKYAYVLSKTYLIALNYDFRIIQAVIIKTIQILDSIFLRAQAKMAHQVQAQRGI